MNINKEDLNKYIELRKVEKESFLKVFKEENVYNKEYLKLNKEERDFLYDKWLSDKSKAALFFRKTNYKNKVDPFEKLKIIRYVKEII